MKLANPPSLDALADGADRLYSLPAVALEVLRLTEQPTLDARQLCECVQSDPAMAAKLLRVVNSSLYGLPHEVASLPQALALLGVEPLKLLVLGFALPDRLYENLTGDALRRYWTESLTTAAAARAIAEAGWGRSGDEALVAGLMQGLGQLVLVGKLGDDYANLLESTAAKPLQPARSMLPLEREALGFEHPELSAELVRRWRLPERLSAAIQAQATDDLSGLTGDDACLAQSLRLANLLTRLVTGGDFAALPILLEQGALYCGLDKHRVNALIGSLQERVRQLSSAMAIELDEATDYREVLVQAHAQMTLLSDQAAIRLMGERRSAEEIDQDEQLARELLTETKRLSAAMRIFLAGGTGPRTDGATDEADLLGPRRRPHSAARATPSLHEAIAGVAEACRQRRQAMTLSLLRLNEESAYTDADVMALRQWIASTELADEFDAAVWLPITRDRCGVLLPGMDRIDANRLWNEAADRLAVATPLRLDAGLAGVASIARGFDPQKMIEAAERCLDAATAVAGPSVKSIEVF